MSVIAVAIRPLRDSDPIVYGKFVGLFHDSGCDRCGSDTTVAVVQLDGHGMMLSMFHPDRVVLLEPSRQS